MTIEEILSQAEKFASQRHAPGSDARERLVYAVRKVQGSYSTVHVSWQFILDKLLAELMSAAITTAVKREQDKILSNFRDRLMRP